MSMSKCGWGICMSRNVADSRDIDYRLIVRDINYRLIVRDINYRLIVRDIDCRLIVVTLCHLMIVDVTNISYIDIDYRLIVRDTRSLVSV